MLLRHWNLYDSIMNSNYTVTKMAPETEVGYQNLLNFLVRINCPIEEAKQQWQYMRQSIKDKLTEKAQLLSDDSTNLAEIVMNSFSLQFDETMQLSAGDMAYAVSSLLEDPVVDSMNAPEKDSENWDPNKPTQDSSSVSEIN